MNQYKRLCLLGLGVLAAVFGGCGKISDADIQHASLGEVKGLVQSRPGVARVIDTRAPSDFAAGHIPGAIRLDLADVPSGKDTIDPALAKFKTLVVYGANPGSSIPPAMTKRLMIAGHKDVKMFDGGMAEWQSAGLKVERSESPPPPPDGAKKN